MKSLNTVYCIILSCFIGLAAQAQELLQPLKYNTTIMQNRQLYGSPKQHLTRLPQLLFFDDFSYSYKTNFPDTSKWVTNNQVYVNATYPLNPPTYGAATFDGINSRGVPYDTVTINVSSVGADTLLTKPINLSGYNSASGIFLSFFYQAQGNGDTPNNGDSLVLEFVNAQGDWLRQWGVNGVDSATGFKQVMIPVTSTDFLYDSFRFRFRNKATIIGNNDHWNIDYIKLGTERNEGDTVLADQAFQKPSTGILKNYRELPWNQFVANPANELSESFRAYVRNNYVTSINNTHNYLAEEIISGTVISNPSKVNFNFPAESNDSNQYNAYNIAPILSLPTAVIKTTYFSANASPEAFPFISNDTLVEYQRFRNFYAYDDGTAEKSYGLQGTGSKGALLFRLNTPDSVQAVRIHWARLQSDQRRKLFSLVIWKSLSPEQVVYQLDFQKPVYIDSLNGEVTYVLDSAIAVSDSFYVGWLQSQTEILNMGYDVNTDSHENLFYNLSTSWVQSAYSGSLMLHPVMGKRSDVIGVGVKEVETAINLNVAPNPADGLLTISNLPQDAEYIVYSVLGSEIQKGKTKNKTVDVSGLEQGLYFIRLLSKENKQNYIAKFVKR